MPTLINNPCRTPTCSQPAVAGKPYCAKCGTRHPQNTTPHRTGPIPTISTSGDPFYSSRTWRRIRSVCLTRHPLCAECLRNGITTVATVVDHIVPRRAGGGDYDVNNLQSLCVSCHNSKTSKEMKLYPQSIPGGRGRGQKS